MQVVPESDAGSSNPAQPPMWLEINVLGTFEVIAWATPPTTSPSEPSQPVSQPVYCRPHSARLLACLALHLPRPLPRDRLVAWLYPDADLDDGRQWLSQALYRLRVELRQAITQLPIPADQVDLTDLIQANPDTIRLTPGRVVVDVLQFEHEAGSGHIEDWRRAIPRYRGELMTELEADWATARRTTLQEGYEQLLAKTCHALVRAGQLSEALTLARRWVNANELDEEANRAFMRIAARLGRFSTALKQFSVLTRIFWDELQTTPSLETRQLAQAIREELQTGWNDNNPGPTLRPEWPFVGRRSERQTLLTAADAALRNQGMVVLLEGESGIGKSTLLKNVAKSADWYGVTVVWGQAQQHSASQLYAPLSEALQNALTSPRLSAIRAKLPATVLDILGHFVPALRPAVEGAASSLAAEPNLRLVAPSDAILQVLVALADQTPHLIILDDVQWADAGFWEAMRVLAPALSSHALSLILSYRDDALRANSTAWNTLRELDRMVNPTLVQLSGLSSEECADLASLLGKPINPAEASHLHQQTHGNPLFVEGQIAGRVPEVSFQKQVAAILEMLPPPTRRMAECAAVLGREFTYTLWQNMVAPDEVMRAVPALTEVRLIHETPHGYRFRHDMLREQVYAAIDPDQRRELHRRAATVLLAAQAEPSLLALHWEQAGQWREAIRAYRSAGNQAEEAGAHTAALQHYAHAFRLLPHLSPQHERSERVKLLCRRQLVYGMQLRLDEWRADIRALELLADPITERLALITALEARMTLSLFASHPEGTRQAGERALILAKTMRRRDVEARIGNILGMHLANLLRRVDQALPMLQDSASFAETAGDGPLLVSALCNLSLAQRLSGACVAARATAARALALSQSHVAGDAARAARATALYALGSADWCLLKWNDALAALNQAVQDQFDLNNMWRAAEALASLAHLHISMGQYDAALDAVERLLTLGRGIGVSPESDVWRWVQMIEADVHTLAGKLDRADVILSALDEWVQSTEDSRYALIGLQARGRWWLEQQRPEEAMRVLKRAHRIWQQRPHAELEPVLLYALAAHRSGETQTAREVLDEVTRYAQTCDGRLHEVLLHAVTHDICGDTASLFAAYNAVQAQAGTLDGAARERFLVGVRLHRDIVQRYQEARPAHQARLTTVPRVVRTVQLARIGTPLGRPLAVEELTVVQWTVDDGDDDALILRRAGKGGLRKHRIQRLVREAADQGAVPTHADLAEALDVNVRTIERDMLQLGKSGITLLTRRPTAHGRSRTDGG